MLIACRSTPHPATGVIPYEAMREAIVRTKLYHVNPEMQDTEEENRIDQKDAEYKEKMKRKREGRQTKEGRLLLGDYVTK